MFSNRTGQGPEMGALKATVGPQGVTFDLGPTEARICGDGIAAIDGLDAEKLSALVAVQEGQLLRLDAITGENLIGSLGGDNLFGDHAIVPDKWYGTLLALGLACGPFERKSQAMNGVVLALMGIAFRNKREPKPEPVEVHLEGGPASFAPRFSDAQRGYLRSLTPEQFEAKMKGFRENIAGPFAAIAKSIDPKLGEIVEQSTEETIAAMREAIATA